MCDALIWLGLKLGPLPFYGSADEAIQFGVYIFISVYLKSSLSFFLSEGQFPIVVFELWLKSKATMWHPFSELKIKTRHNQTIRSAFSPPFEQCALSNEDRELKKKEYALLVPLYFQIFFLCAHCAYANNAIKMEFAFFRAWMWW